MELVADSDSLLLQVHRVVEFANRFDLHFFPFFCGRVAGAEEYRTRNIER
jgi:hypothetical protein